MSYPPRPPMGMPPMPPYGYAPMGMMPMPMGMMPPGPMMRPPGPNSGPPPPKMMKKTLVPQEIPTKDSDEKPPVTTVFVGNISDRAPDAMVRQLLQRCGNVLSWKRVQGASGKLQAFGFCEYEDPEATLRCMRLVNDWQIAEKRLVVKVDAKTKALLDEHRRKKKAREKSGSGDSASKESNGDKEEGEMEDDGEESGEEVLDEFSQREDRVAMAGLEAIMREYSADLAKAPPVDASQEERKARKKEKDKEKLLKEEGLDDMELEEDKKDLINREIRSFRDAHKMVLAIEPHQASVLHH